MKSKRTLRHLACMALVGLLQAGSVGIANADGDFGSKPYAAVDRAASTVIGNTRINTCGMSKAQLTAAMIAVTYNESGNQTETFAPAPGALARGDVNRETFYVSKDAFAQESNPRRRVTWHPGVGLWQYDDQGAGTSFSVEKLTATGLATEVGTYLVQRFCMRGRTPAAMFSMNQWSGCGKKFHTGPDANDCIYYYNQLYDSTSGRLKTINKPAMSDGGGTQKRLCQIGTDQAAETFDCYLVIPGKDTTEHCPAAMCDRSPTADVALSKPFYVWKAVDKKAGKPAEARYWPESSTGGVAYVAMRTYGINSRNQRLAAPVASNMKLCDFTIGGPNCPPAPRCRQQVGRPC